MEQKEFKPYVDPSSRMKELTVRAVGLGVVMAVVLGTANAYVGMKAGLTVSAVFPAAVVAMAALRIVRGSILEENIARTTASVGEALVAGAIFTIPAFVITGVWGELDYLKSSLIMLIGGLLGVLYVTILRRSLVSEAGLPFPESVAATEMVKAGQKGQSGAKYVFGAMGLAAVWEIFKNTNGIQFVKDSGKTFVSFAKSKIELLGEKFSYSGGFLFESPAASPMLAGVGFIVGPRISSVLFSGSVMGWLLLVPIGIFLNPDLNTLIESGKSWLEIGEEIWLRQVRPLAVGTMIVASFYTLYNMRSALMIGITRAFGDIGKVKASSEAVSRVDRDLNFRKVIVAIIAMGVPVFLLYLWFSGSVGGSISLTILMIIIGFLFAAVAGYLVGLVGSSNNPISGLTLSSLLIAALLVVFIGVTGSAGIAAVLGVAGVVCCAAGVSGDMMQDLKVGYLLGGTPWKMQVSEIIGVIVAALILALPMQLMHKAYVIGSANLPAPQAGLMALMAEGIVGGEMAWQLVVAGMFFAIALILIKAPSPMLIAVGMYLPFSSTGAIFVGGIIRSILDYSMQKKNASAEEKTKAETTGILLSSGFIAGESLMAVALALLFGAVSYFELDFSLTNFGLDSPSALLGMLVFVGLLYMLVSVPMRVARSSK